MKTPSVFIRFLQNPWYFSRIFIKASGVFTGIVCKNPSIFTFFWQNLLMLLQDHAKPLVFSLHFEKDFCTSL